MKVAGGERTGELKAGRVEKEEQGERREKGKEEGGKGGRREERRRKGGGRRGSESQTVASTNPKAEPPTLGMVVPYIKVASWQLEDSPLLRGPAKLTLFCPCMLVQG